MTTKSMQMSHSSLTHSPAKHKKIIDAEEHQAQSDDMRLACDRMSVRHAAKAHGVESPYVVQPKYLRGR